MKEANKELLSIKGEFHFWLILTFQFTVAMIEARPKGCKPTMSVARGGCLRQKSSTNPFIEITSRPPSGKNFVPAFRHQEASQTPFRYENGYSSKQGICPR